jgi:hypothetical protein
MENPSKLVTLLEQDYTYAKVSGTQDMRATLLAGLFWETNYWVDCALKWIEQGAEIDEEVFSRLQAISTNKNYPQSTRHTAIKQIKRWQRAAYT